MITIDKLIFILKGQYHHNQRRPSTGHGIGVLVLDEDSDWKLLPHLRSSNGNIMLGGGGRCDTPDQSAIRVSVDKRSIEEQELVKLSMVKPRAMGLPTENVYSNAKETYHLFEM